MKTLSKTSTRPNYLFGLLPHYFKENDNYVPNSVAGYTDKGLLERYLEIFCQEVDSNIAPYIDQMGYLYDAKELHHLPHSDPSRFLDHISELFNNPPTIGTDAQFVNLVRYIRLILQTKGSKQSVEYFLSLYGYKIYSLSEPTITPNIYDVNLEYDESNKFDLNFDLYSSCDLVITDLPGKTPTDPGSPWMTNQLKPALQKFIFPIFAVLNSVTYHS